MPILIRQIAYQENFIIALLNSVKPAPLLAVSARQIQRHALGASMNIFMLIPPINVSRRLQAAHRESKIRI